MNTPLSQLTTSAAAFAQPERVVLCKCGVKFVTTSRVAKHCGTCSRYAQIQRGKGAAK